MRRVIFWVEESDGKVRERKRSKSEVTRHSAREVKLIAPNETRDRSRVCKDSGDGNCREEEGRKVYTSTQRVV